MFCVMSCSWIACTIASLFHDRVFFSCSRIRLKVELIVERKRIHFPEDKLLFMLVGLVYIKYFRLTIWETVNGSAIRMTSWWI